MGNEQKQQPTMAQDQIAAQQGWITVKRASELAGKAVGTVYYWIKNGHVKGTQIGRDHYVDYSSLKAHLGEDGCRILGLPEHAEDV